MSTTRVSILFEDRFGLPDQFGPFRLLKAVVQDRRGIVGPAFAIHQEVVALAMKGNNKMLEWIRDLGTNHPLGEPVIAVFDSDRVQELVPGAKSESEICSTLRKDSDAPERLTVLLLDKNTETLLKAVRQCGPELVSTEEFDVAIGKKRSNINTRDVILGRAAAPERRTLRDCVLKLVPSFAQLRDAVIALLGTPGTPPTTA